MRYQKPDRNDYLQICHPEPVPIPLRNAKVEKEKLQAWAEAGVREDIKRLDAIGWDLAALAVTAFYARTPGESIDARFQITVDDYFEWRGIDPRRRTEALRQEVIDHIRLLCSERFHVFSTVTLHVTQPATGRKKKETFTHKARSWSGPAICTETDSAAWSSRAPDALMAWISSSADGPRSSSKSRR